MIKSCRKYWTKEIADAIVQLKGIRFINPQMNLRTTFDRQDFTRIITDEFHVPAATVRQFFDDLRAMNYYDHNPETTGEMFERYFPGRDDVQRLLMEPITYANGSTLRDPAITYGIVFSNFMGAGVYTFRGGTDVLIKQMVAELQRNGAEVRKHVRVEKILTERREGKRVVAGVVANGREIRAKVVLSNANIKNTTMQLVGAENLPADYRAEVEKVRINTSSCQVYFGIRKGESIPHVGDLLFTSEAPKFSSDELVDLHTRSRTFSVYYPDTRPGSDRYTVVASLNARYEDWEKMTDAEYAQHKQRLIDESLAALERHIGHPGKDQLDGGRHATHHRALHHAHRHLLSPSSRAESLHGSARSSASTAGSVGIIMSATGTINYGVITANQIDKLLFQQKRGVSVVEAAGVTHQGA